jgi:hypothetical protein
VGLLWIRKRERTTFAQWRRGVGIVMSSPIPTRNRASITLPSPCFMFDDVEENKHKSEDLFGCLRRPLLKALHVSTSSRRPFFSPASLELELVEIDFWSGRQKPTAPTTTLAYSRLLPGPTTFCFVLLPSQSWNVM